jgi:uncharacterized membrane protein YfcA
LNLGQAILLFAAGILGGILNAVAGGGSFIGFPSLLFAGVPPIPANATNTVALWTGVVASGGAYRHRLDVPARVLLPLLMTSCIGGAAGALLLLKTPPHTFMRVIPWLMLAATLLFILGKRVGPRSRLDVGADASLEGIILASLLELGVASYGGYFGGGVGIVNLALFAALGMTDIHAMNALKSVMGTAINGVAVLVFIISRAVYWPQAAVMIVGSVIGGYFGAHYAQRLPQLWIRRAVICVGVCMTIYFFVKAYAGLPA